MNPWIAVRIRYLPLALCVSFLTLAGCSSHTAMPVTTTKPEISATVTGPAWFEDVTKTTGIDFAYRNGEEVKPAHLSILESLGGGLGVIDFDRDGLLDLVFPGGGHFGGPDQKTILGHAPRLYRNEGGWKFTDVTASRGLGSLADGMAWFYTHGVCVGDSNRDGWPDLLFTGWGRIVLFRNEPDGQGGRTFVDRSREAGLDRDVTWATSAGWADFDGDGHTDLFVGQYVDWSFANHPDCNYDGKTPDVCPPKKFKGLPSKLYRNTGDGKFVEVGAAAGIRSGGENASKTLGVLIVDVNKDGRPDVYVANDTVANFLYINNSKPGMIQFAEQGMIAGVALDGGGSANGSMGLDAGDPEGTGLPALWVTNYENEFHALYRNRSDDKRISFVFATQASGVGAIGQKFVGWGTGFADFDHDGWEDLFIGNGHAIRFPAGATRLQRPVLFRNRNGKFTEISKQGGGFFQAAHLSRGVISADLDNDGRLDLIFTQMNEPAAILRNVVPATDNQWLGLELQGAEDRSIVGARIVLEAGGRTQTRFAKSGGSYASSPDRRIHFGLGTATTANRLTIHWPDGRSQSWNDVATDRFHRVVQGETSLQPLTAKK